VLFRSGGEAFRVGGDEFALLLPGRDAVGARKVAAAVLGRAATVDVGNPGEGGVRISAGVAVFPTHCGERNDLYRCADEALYASKREGGDGVVIYAPPQPPEIQSVSA
jgi:diguanylate cyclase (GGDEF)-like protein